MDKTSEPEAVSYLRRIILGGAYPTNADLLAIDPWDINMIEEYYYNNSIFLEKYIERLKNIIPNEKD